MPKTWGSLVRQFCDECTEVDKAEVAVRATTDEFPQRLVECDL